MTLYSLAHWSQKEEESHMEQSVTTCISTSRSAKLHLRLRPLSKSAKMSHMSSKCNQPSLAYGFIMLLKFCKPQDSCLLNMNNLKI